jgi:beta-lactamase class C
LLALLFLSAAHAVAQPADERAEIDAAVRGFMERSGAPGVAVGIVTPAGRRFFWYGVASKQTGRPVDERTLFEIGSISKTFAATLTAYAAETGALKLDDSVSTHVPELKGSHFDKVSLLNLATHTTGGMPLQFPAEVKTNADVTAYFRKWSPPATPGTVRAYANPSAGLLGVATARALKGDFATLVREKVIAPLGLAHTFYEVPDTEQAHYAQGYARDGRPVRVSPAPLWREAYGVRTTAGDLLRYVEAQLGLHDTDPALRRALTATHIGHYRAGPMTQALIWEWYPYPVSGQDFAAGHADAMVFRPNPITRLHPPRAPPADAVVDKTGGTGGFGAYAAFIPGRRIGLVILANRNHDTLLRVALAERLFAAVGAPGVGGER